MSLSQRHRVSWTTIVTDSTAEVFFPATDFREVRGATSARAWAELRARSGSLLLAFAYQTANDVRSPDSGAIIKLSGGDVNGFANANGMFDPDSTHTTLSVSGKLYIRFGFVGKVSSGTGFGRIAGTVEVLH